MGSEVMGSRLVIEHLQCATGLLVCSSVVATLPGEAALPSSFKGVSRLAFTARIGRAQFHRARSARKKVTWTHPPPSLLAAVHRIG